MSYFDTLNSGVLVNLIAAQVDIVDHSKLDSDSTSVQNARRILQQNCERIAESRGGMQLRWEGDGGVFIFPAAEVAQPDEAVMALFEIVNHTHTTNLEVMLRTDLSEELAIRISCDTGSVHWNTDYRQIHGDWLNTFLKHERSIGIGNTVVISERVLRLLNPRTRKLFVQQGVSAELNTRLFTYTDTRPTGWRFGLIDRQAAFRSLISRAPSGSVLRFVSITAASDLIGQGGSMKSHLAEAFIKGKEFYGIVLDPTSIEAKCRGNAESPGAFPSLLQTDADRVRYVLRKAYKDQSIFVRQSRIGLPFKLWMSETEALIEPIHLGKSGEGQDQGGLCGFTLLRFTKNDPEYAVLLSHFETLWNSSAALRDTSHEFLFDRVEIEVNTQCNRDPACQHCPNSVPEIASAKPDGEMSLDLFKKIIDELSELEFAGRLSFHFYGEPLLRSDLHQLVAYARTGLSRAELVLYTNGDFLTGRRYDALVAAGIDNIVVSNSDSCPSREKQRVLSDIHYDNRGGALGEIRTLNLPCYAPTSRLVIGYDGQVLLCYEDARRVHGFGSVRDHPITEIWWSDRLEGLRRDLARGRRNLHDPCRVCDNQSHVRPGQVNVNLL